MAGPVRLEALKSALADVVDRHECLRRRVAGEHGWPVACWYAGAGGAVSLTEMRASLAAARAVRESVSGYVDLAKEPPFRFHLITESEEVHRLELVFHPIAFDTPSVRPFLRDLAYAYASRCAERKPRWPKRAPRHADHAAFVQHRVGKSQSHVVAPENCRCWEPWKTSRRVGGTVQSSGGIETLGMRLNPGLHRRLMTRTNRARASLVMVLHSALGTGVGAGNRFEKRPGCGRHQRTGPGGAPRHGRTIDEHRRYRCRHVRGILPRRRVGTGVRGAYRSVPEPRIGIRAAARARRRTHGRRHRRGGVHVECPEKGPM